MAPKLTFISGDLSEQARYICFLARSLQIRKYASTGHLVLPYLVPGHPKIIFFPDLGYTSEFWHSLETHKNYSLTQDFPSQATDEIVTKLQSQPSLLPTKEVKGELLKNWEHFVSVGKSCLDFATLLPRISEIKILLTQFGTQGSFSKKIYNGRIDLYITAREDLPWQSVFRTLLQSFILISQESPADVGTIAYHQRLGILDYLSRHPSLKSFLVTKEISPLLTPAMIADSHNYLHRLCLSPQLVLDSYNLRLTRNEALLFNYLWRHPEVLLTFSQAGEVVWKNRVDEKFSLYALAKLVEGIRKKIRASGANPHLLHTLRKRGYILFI